MKPWLLIDQAVTPDGETISLHQHDASYVIRIGGVELMSTRRHTSEERLAELACAHVKATSGARVLVGGLGFGFTLRAALAVVGSDAEVFVAELFDAVIQWNRNAAFGLAADAMADPRVTVLSRDVGKLIRSSHGSFDSIILDVDNGPGALSATDNSRLYDLDGLRRTRAALRPDGCAAFWSAQPDPAFEKLLIRAGFVVEVQRCQARLNSGNWHTLFLARIAS